VCGEANAGIGAVGTADDATATAVALARGAALVASTGPATGPPEASRSNDPAAACQDLSAGAMVACLHGNDAPPPGVSLYERPTLGELEARSSLRSPNPRLRGLADLEQATSPRASDAEPAAVRCIGNSISGNRIQAIYAHALDVPDRYPRVVTSLREWMAEADQAVWTSAGQTGGGKRLRLVTDSTCQLDIAREILTRLGDDSFSQMRSELAFQGFNRTDRKYLVWVDAAVGICGLGEVYGDTRPSPGQPQQPRPVLRPGGHAVLAVRRTARDLPQPGRGPARRPARQRGLALHRRSRRHVL
jgi:hypothetical protein